MTTLYESDIEQLAVELLESQGWLFQFVIFINSCSLPVSSSYFNRLPYPIPYNLIKIYLFLLRNFQSDSQAVGDFVIELTGITGTFHKKFKNISRQICFIQTLMIRALHTPTACN